MRYVFDTNALISLFDGEMGSNAISEFMHRLETKEAEGFISVITLTELYYLYKQRKGAETANAVIEQIRLSKLKRAVITSKIALIAGEYKGKAIPIADSLIAATAKALDAKLITNDDDFKGLGLEIVNF
ncbi:MAG: PIN domain-containing protein [Candidatus Micrarchaeota archaeon]|nr:PIN domain-containing protein [Candidatus Micrarchaeota archaeon]